MDGKEGALVRSTNTWPEPVSEVLVRPHAFIEPEADTPTGSRKAVTEVLTFGRGDFGQLMQPSSGNIAQPMRVDKLQQSNIALVAASTFSTVVVTDLGSVLCSGNNDEGQLVPERDDKHLFTPVHLDALSAQAIVQIAAGESHVALVNQSQVVVTMGSNEYGQLGHSPNQAYRVPPRVVRGLGSRKAVQVACGEAHTTILTNQGEVFTIGNGALGALGHGSRENCSEATRVEKLNGVPITQIASGAHHNIAVTVSGLVYGWGRNRKGHLGLSVKEYPHAAYSPTRITALPELVQQAACGDDHTVFVTRTGRAFVCGRGDRGQLGLGLPSAMEDDDDAANKREDSGEPVTPATAARRHPLAVVDQPTRVSLLEGTAVRQAACGRDHTLLLLHQGDVMGMGANEANQLGLESTEDQFSPVVIPGLQSCGVFNIACGAEHSIAVRVVRGSVLSGPPGSLPRGTMMFASVDDALDILQYTKESGDTVPLKRLFRDVFAQPNSLNGSFLQPHPKEPWFTEYRAPGAPSLREMFQPRSRRHTASGSVVSPPPRHLLKDGQSSQRDEEAARPMVDDDEDTGEARAGAGAGSGVEGRSVQIEELDNSSPEAQRESPSETHSSSYRVVPPPEESAAEASGEEEVGVARAPPMMTSPDNPRSSNGMRVDTSQQFEVRPAFSGTTAFFSGSHSNEVDSRSPLCGDMEDAGERSVTSAIWPPPELISLAPSDKVGKGMPYHAEPMVAKRLEHSGLDLEGLESVYDGILVRADNDCLAVLYESFRSVLHELKTNAPHTVEPDSLRAFLILSACPLLGKSDRLATEMMTRLCDAMLSLPKDALELLFAWIGADMPNHLYAIRLVSALQEHLSALLRSCTEGNLERLIVTGISTLQAAELVTRVLRLHYRLNESIARRNREKALFGHVRTRDTFGITEGDDIFSPHGRQPSRASSGSQQSTESARRHASSEQRPPRGLSGSGSAAGGGGVSPADHEQRRRHSSLSEVDILDALHPREVAEPGTPSGEEVLRLEDLSPESLESRVWGKVAWQEFNNEAVSNLPEALLRQDYDSWLRSLRNSSGPRWLVLCRYPFLLDARAKRRILSYEAALHMGREMRNALVRSFMAESPYLIFEIRRSHLLADALDHIGVLHPDMLKKPLKVVFRGEEGIDEGGVTKEFFQLLVEELFNEDFAMFRLNPETREFWFRPDTIESGQEFRLVGAIMGLAIYNSVLLDVHFPQAVYKKLLGLPVGLADLIEVDPVLGKGLLQLLQYKGGNIEDTFGLTFVAEFDFFGERRTEELKEGGADIFVNEENREEYVRLYVDWFLNQSISSQFHDFARGFTLVMDGAALHLFRPEELELLVTGTPHLDFHELERVTQYDGGFHRDHPTIRSFWNVVHSWPLALQKKMLLFVTGSAKAPIGGLGRLRFVIQRNGTDSVRMPTASTCFNILLLPEYSSEATLREKLEMAIEECRGFGLQ